MQSNEIAPDGVDSCGTRLRQARERAGLSQEEVSARLRMPVRVVRALESDDWSQAGAPVFVRGQLRSYSRLLGVELDLDSVQQEVGSIAPSELVSHSHTPRYQRMFEHATRRAVYIAITAVIAVPVWLATRPHLSNGELNVQSLEVQAVRDEADSTPPPARKPPERTPLIASMGTMRSTAAEAPELTITFNGESWVQVFDADGGKLEQGLLAEGERRSYDEGEVGRLVIGNASEVEVRRDGELVDLAPFSRANVARFTLSSDGSLAPVVD